MFFQKFFAHFKLLQHPLRKTKGSVLLSAVIYTYSPASPPLPLPYIVLEDMCGLLATEQSVNTSSQDGQLNPGHGGQGSLKSQPHILRNTGSSSGTQCLWQNDVNPILTVYLKLYSASRRQLRYCTHGVAGFLVHITWFTLIFSYK